MQILCKWPVSDGKNGIKKESQITLQLLDFKSFALLLGLEPRTP